MDCSVLRNICWHRYPQEALIVLANLLSELGKRQIGWQTLCYISPKRVFLSDPIRGASLAEATNHA